MTQVKTGGKKSSPFNLVIFEIHLMWIEKNNCLRLCYQDI